MLKKWMDVASVEEFASTDRKLVELEDNVQVGLFKVGEDFLAISPWCSHQKRSLMSGPVDGAEIMCPLHGARFDLNTGKHLSLPAVRPIPTYKVKVEGDRIFIRA